MEEKSDRIEARSEPKAKGGVRGLSEAKWATRRGGGRVYVYLGSGRTIHEG